MYLQSLCYLQTSLRKSLKWWVSIFKTTLLKEQKEQTLTLTDWCECLPPFSFCACKFLSLMINPNKIKNFQVSLKNRHWNFPRKSLMSMYDYLVRFIDSLKCILFKSTSCFRANSSAYLFVVQCIISFMVSILEK